MKDVRAGEAQEKFTVISTFAGGGGSSTGYRLAGGKILAINEFVKEARETYSANYPTTPIIPDDIKELTGKDILEVAGISEGELVVDQLITGRVGLDGVAQAFDDLNDPEVHAKIVVEPWK